MLLESLRESARFLWRQSHAGAIYFKHRHPSLPSLSASDRALVDKVSAQGFVVIPGFWSASRCERARAELDAFLRESPREAWRGPAGADQRVFACERVSATFADFHHDPWLHSLAEAFMRCEAKTLFTLANRLQAVPGNLGSGQGWHRDSFGRQFKAILYLSEVGSDSGPFQYLAGSGRTLPMLGDLWRASVEARQRRLCAAEVAHMLGPDRERLRTLVGAPGTLILAHTRGVHRGSPIRAGTRHALTNYYIAEPDLSAEAVDHFNQNPIAGGRPLSLAEIRAG